MRRGLTCRERGPMSLPSWRPLRVPDPIDPEELRPSFPAPAASRNELRSPEQGAQADGIGNMRQWHPACDQLARCPNLIITCPNTANPRMRFNTSGLRRSSAPQRSGDTDGSGASFDGSSQGCGFGHAHLSRAKSSSTSVNVPRYQADTSADTARDATHEWAQKARIS